MLRKPITGGVILLFLLVSLFPMVSSNSSPYNNIIYVDDDNTGGPWDGTQKHPYQNIQDGIDAASNGDTVYVYSGTYYENIVIDKSINLIGEDRNTTLIDGSESGHIIRIDSDSVTINSFTVQNSGHFWAIGCQVYYAPSQNLRDIHISDCILKNNSGGILFNNISVSSISNCHIYDHNGLSIEVLKLSENISINNCTIYNNGEEIEDGWIHPGSITIDGENDYWCSNITIVNCNIHNIVGQGVIIFKVDNIKILNNSIHENSGGGICLYQVRNVEIIRNNIYENTKTGISISYCSNQQNDGNVHVLINKNNVSNNGRGTIPCGGITLSHCDYFTINQNTVSLNGKGIILYNSSGDVIENNLIKNSGLSIFLRKSVDATILRNIIVDSYEGMSIYYSDNNIISDNIVSDNFKGISIYYSDNNTILGNNISKNIWKGICLDFSKYNTISSNFIIQNEEYGIDLNSSCSNIVSSNTISKNYEGIYFDNSNDNIILNNNFLNNRKNAFFHNSYDNKWNGNYWNRPRVFPKPIFGRKTFPYNGLFRDIDFQIPWINFDWHPAQEPYDITIPKVA